jgi:hypothetical protein
VKAEAGRGFTTKERKDRKERGGMGKFTEEPSSSIGRMLWARFTLARLCRDGLTHGFDSLERRRLAA